MKKWIILLGVLVGLIILLLVQSSDWKIRHPENLRLSTSQEDGGRIRVPHVSSVRNTFSGIIRGLEHRRE